MNAHLPPSHLPSEVAEPPLPPHDLAAEQAVIGGLMLSPESLAKVSDWLMESDFFRKDHRLIFRAVSELQRRGSPCDAVTLGDWFESNGLAEMAGGAGYLIELANSTPSAANIVAYAEIVVEKSRLRAVIATGKRITASAAARGAESQQIIGNAAHELAQLQASKLHGALEPVKGAMKRMQVELMARYQRGPGLLGLPWPWRDLNDCTKGLRDGVLYVVGGRPSMGKSIFGLQTAVFTALHGNNTAFFSVEMGAQECMVRAVACVGEIPLDWVENPAKEDEDSEFFWARLADATQRIVDSPLLMDETPSITIDQMMARARRAHMQKPLRLVVLDHMHDMGTDAKREVRHEYGRIAQGAKTLAKELRCPVILLAQLNRSIAGRADKRPTMTDLRESGEIEQKADVILFLHREDYYDRDTHLQGVVEVIPAKGRNIRTGKPIALQNTFSEMRMQDWDGHLPAAPSKPSTATRGFRYPSDRTTTDS
jgi:replicative DNA helicase